MQESNLQVYTLSLHFSLEGKPQCLAEALQRQITKLTKLAVLLQNNNESDWTCIVLLIEVLQSLLKIKEVSERLSMICLAGAKMMKKSVL